MTAERSGPAWDELTRFLGEDDPATSMLASGRTGPVLRVDARSGESWACKFDPSGDGGLECEGAMLRAIGEHAAVPVPAVAHVSPHLLVLSWCEGSTGVPDAAADHAASALARLHRVTAESYGYGSATRIGGLPQPNPRRRRWREFFGEARLLGFAEAAHEEGRVDAALVRLMERVADRLDDIAPEPERPALVHGDLWSGNVLTQRDRLTAFLDPALYFGHPEVDLAFATMFGGFSRRFFDAYRERAGGELCDADFWARRRHLWNLYPLLVHARLFGGSYVDELVRSARRFA